MPEGTEEQLSQEVMIMPETLETLQARLQQTQLDYLRTLQETWDVWLKQCDDLNKQVLKAQQDAIAKLQSQTAAAGCAAPAPGKK